jgi:hypothetical protein
MGWRFVAPGSGTRTLKRLAASVTLTPPIASPEEWKTLPLASTDRPAVVEKYNALESIGWERTATMLTYPRGSCGQVGAEAFGRAPRSGERYLTLRYHSFHVSRPDRNWGLQGVRLTDASGKSIRLERYCILSWQGRSDSIYLGLNEGVLTPERSEQTGAAHGIYVVAVEPGSPAQHAGIRTGDVVLAIAGKACDKSASLWRVSQSLRPGRPVPVEVMRSRRREHLSLVPETRPYWEGINHQTLLSARERLKRLVPARAGDCSFAEYRFQSNEPMPDAFVPVKAEGRFLRWDYRPEPRPIRFEFRDIAIPEAVVRALHA